VNRIPEVSHPEKSILFLGSIRHDDWICLGRWFSSGVDAPNNGEPLTLGYTYNITWTYSGVTHIKLVLFQNGTLVEKIAPDILPSIHTYTWSVGQLANGTKVNPGTGFKVRVRTIDNGPYDDSAAAFAIAADNTNPNPLGKFRATEKLDAAFEFIEPTTSTAWNITEKHKIRWKVLHKVKYPLSVDLILSDHKTVAMNIGTFSEPVRTAHEGGIEWTIPKNVADGQYHIRLTSADRKAERLSPLFRIGSTRVKVFNIAPETIANKVHWQDVRPGGGAFSKGNYAVVECPGSGVIRYGYQRYYSDEDNYGRRLYRSFVFFNVNKEIIMKLKSLGVVKSASLNWQKAPGSPHACQAHVHCLDAPLTLGDGSSMFGDGFAAFPKHRILGSQSTIDMMQVWLNDAGKNYGLVIGALDEGQPKTTGQCVQCSNNVVLTVEVEEKLR